MRQLARHRYIRHSPLFFLLNLESVFEIKIILVKIFIFTFMISFLISISFDRRLIFLKEKRKIFRQKDYRRSRIVNYCSKLDSLQYESIRGTRTPLWRNILKINRV